MGQHDVVGNPDDSAGVETVDFWVSEVVRYAVRPFGFAQGLPQAFVEAREVVVGSPSRGLTLARLGGGLAGMGDLLHGRGVS